jgi:hypothetical protein
MTINGVKAVITYDADIDLFHGEVIGLNGDADFYAGDAEDLRRGGAISLKVFMWLVKKTELNPIAFGVFCRFLAHRLQQKYKQRQCNDQKSVTCFFVS